MSKNNIEKTIDQLQKLIGDSEKTSEALKKANIHDASKTHTDYAQAYWNVKQFIEVNFLENTIIPIFEIAEELARNGIGTTNDFDSERKMLYINLNTSAKSHLHLYADGTIRGRYDYEGKIDLTLSLDEIIILLCQEFNDALYGRSFGMDSWFSLLEAKGIKAVVYT